MKKIKFTGMAIITILITIVTFNAKINSSDQYFNTTLDNIVALYRFESGVDCYYDGSLDCPETSRKAKYIAE